MSSIFQVCRSRSPTIADQSSGSTTETGSSTRRRSTVTVIRLRCCSLRAASVPVGPLESRGWAIVDSGRADGGLEISLAQRRPSREDRGAALRRRRPRRWMAPRRGTGPSSMMTAREAPSAVTTSPAVCASGSPERLAEVTAIGPRIARERTRHGVVRDAHGQRTVSTGELGGDQLGAQQRQRSVSGPGQNRSARRRPRRLRPRAPRPGRARRSGRDALVEARCLAAIRAWRGPRPR